MNGETDNAMWQPVGTAIKMFLKGVIRAYQWLLAPILGNNCRFHPNCSAFALEAIETHGVGIGAWLAVKRISRCNPWHAGGFDPVPERRCEPHITTGPTPKTASGGSAGL